MVLQEFMQRLACQVIEGDFFAGRGQRRSQVQVMADPHVERSLARFFGCLPKGLARGEIVVHRLAKGRVQLGAKSSNN